MDQQTGKHLLILPQIIIMEVELTDMNLLQYLIYKQAIIIIVLMSIYLVLIQMQLFIILQMAIFLTILQHNIQVL